MGIDKVVCCFLFTIVLSQNGLSSANVAGSILTNQLIDIPEKDGIKELPFCRSGSACGFLQVNAFGINQEQFCRCPSETAICSLHWDPEDGHSVTMRSQQFKFCGPIPKLHTCKHKEVAYRYAVLYDQATFDVLGVMNNLHCFCPAPRDHLFRQSIDEVMDTMHVLGAEHTCGMLPFCGNNEACKEISSTASSSLVTSNCLCRRGFICPTLSTEAKSNEMNNVFPNGKAYSIYCQTWY